jgi:hypothetical protein
MSSVKKQAEAVTAALFRMPSADSGKFDATAICEVIGQALYCRLPDNDFQSRFLSESATRPFGPIKSNRPCLEV